MKQMRLAQTDAAVKKKRIVRFARRFGHRLGGGEGEVVVRTNDEGLESVFRIEMQVTISRALVIGGLFGGFRGFGG